MNGTKTIFDRLDLDIIAHLQEDGRKPFREIALDTGVTEKTVRLRVNQLRESNVLQIVGVVNPIEFGLQVGALVQLSVEESHMTGCVERLREMIPVRFVTVTSGEYQLLLQVIMKSYHDVSRFIQHDLAELPGLRRTNTIIQLEVLKNEFRLVRDELIDFTGIK